MTERDCAIGIGWIIDETILPKNMKKLYPEKNHQERRYDPKTGEAIESETIIDEEEKEVFVLDEKEYEDDFEFYEALAKKVGASATSFGDFNNGESLHMIELPLTRKDIIGKGFNRVKLDVIIQKRPKLDGIKRSLRELGIVVGEPEIVLQESFS